MTMTDDGPLDEQIRAIERAEELDRMWFEEHPRRCIRLRYMRIGEFGLHREDLWAGMRSLCYTIVFRACRSSGTMVRPNFFIITT
jgi:hypothetical protein